MVYKATRHHVAKLYGWVVGVHMGVACGFYEIDAGMLRALDQGTISRACGHDLVFCEEQTVAR
jgi:hypothetical protein